MNWKQIIPANKTQEKNVFSKSKEQLDWKVICNVILTKSISLDCLSSKRMLSFWRHCVKSNGVSRIKKLVDQNLILNSHDAGSLLWIAVKNRCSEISWILVRAGADLSLRCGGYTFLHELAMRSNEPKSCDLAILMLQHGIDPHALDERFGKSALYYAVQLESNALIKELLDRDAFVDYHMIHHIYWKYEISQSSFHRALEMFVDQQIKRQSLINILWDLVRMPDEPTMFASFEKALALGVCVEELTNNYFDYEKLFLGAMTLGKFNVAGRLLEYGVDFDLNKKEIQLLLGEAVRHKRSVITRWLIKKGANIHCNYGRNHESPLYRACVFASEENSELLLELGADIYAKTSYGDTPIEVACEREGSELLSVIKQLAFSVCQGLAVDEKYLDFSRMSVNNHKFYEKCLSELEQMKNTYVFAKISFYSVLTNANKVTFLTRNEVFQENYRQSQRELLFPLYYKALDVALENAIRRKNALANQENAFCEAVYGILPYLVVEKILFYFYESDTVPC